MTIYLSGKVTGLNPENYEKKFKEAQNYLESKGHSVLNPIEVYKGDDMHEMSEYEALRSLVAYMLGYCDAIYMLHDWQESKGATIELSICRLLNLPIYYQHEGKL